jgi:hypothetical protein
MADIASGGAGTDGKLTIQATDDQIAARLFTQAEHTEPLPGGTTPGVTPGPTTVAPGGGGTRIVRGGRTTIVPDIVAITGTLVPASDRFEIGHDGRGGVVEIRGASGTATVSLNGGEAADAQPVVTIGASGRGGSLRVLSTDARATFEIAQAADNTTLNLGGQARFGQLRVLDSQNRQRMLVYGETGQIYLYDDTGRPTVILDAMSGDVVLGGADIAEEFDVAEDVEPGCVVHIAPSGRLERTNEPYDMSVAGVVSGLGDFRPGIVLDRRAGSVRRLPVAMLGKVTCLVDASDAPVRRGTLLTSSDRPGYAMAASDRERAFGAVIGKALGDLSSGVGTVPLLVGRW